MTILFMGGEMGAFVPSDASTRESTTSTSWYDSGFARCTLLCGNGSTSQYAESAAFTSTDDLYLHFDVMRDSVATTDTPIAVLVSGSTEVFRIKGSGTVLQMQALIGAVWTNVGGTITYDHDTLQTIDLYINGDSATGEAKLYLSGTLRETASAVDLSAVLNMTKVRFYGITQGHRVSQVIVADEPTIGWKLMTRYPSAAGATSSWTGAYTDIDEAAFTDGDFILSGTADQVSTFAQTGPAITGYTVRAVAVAARAKRGASGPQNMRHALRVSGTDYFSASDIALDVGYSATLTIWEQNPVTTADWLNTAIDALQPGVKSIA